MLSFRDHFLFILYYLFSLNEHINIPITPTLTMWKDEYKAMKPLSKFQIKLLDDGPHSLSQSWYLQAMHSDWKRRKGIIDPEPPNCQSSFKEFDSRCP